MSANPTHHTAVDLFLEVGRLLYEGDDWQSQFAADLNVPTTRIRNIRRGKADLGRGNAMLDDALKTAERIADAAQRDLTRAKERVRATTRARNAIRAWKEKSYQPTSAASRAKEAR
jgi:hypothetical protein